MTASGKIVVEGIECRFVNIGDTILPEDYNCKVDILAVLAGLAKEVYDIVERLGWD